MHRAIPPGNGRQRQYRRTTMGGRTKMLLHGQPLCQSGNNATLHKGARMVPPVHKPGIEMGDIDTMSRLAAHENPTAKEIQQRCPTLTPSTNAHFTTRTTAEAVLATRPTPNPPEHT